MRIMTFNLRFDNDGDGDNCWCRRRDLVIDVIERSAPAILGTQEGTPRQLSFLRERLCGYEIHTPERIWDETCQYTTLFFLRDRFKVKDGGEFWLSTTPRVHRSKDWDSAFPRMMSYALLECTSTGRDFWTVVTHLDHVGVEARRKQAGILLEWMGERTVPAILMGDFNDRPGSAVHRILTSSKVGLRDTWEVLGRSEGDESMTHHGFLGKPQKCRMDWILTTSHFRVLDAVIVRDHSEGLYPSDHFPYVADFECPS